MNNIIEKAREFALEAHGTQIYAEKFSYFTHLEMVVACLQEFGHTDEKLLASAYLHDTIEDTHVSYQDIKKEFGEEIAEIVYCVTDELGRNRHERHVKTYPKIATNDKALIVKLADRIANVSFSKDKIDMYRKEHKEFKTALYNGSHEEMWQKLDDLFLDTK